MKLFRLLSKVDKRKINRFEQFLRSPYFNQRKDVLSLLELWVAGSRQRQLPEVLWQQIFPEAPFSTTKWHLLTSRLFKLLEEFLALEIWRNQPVGKKANLANAFRELNEEKLFAKAIDATQQELEGQAYRNMQYLQVMHELAYEKYDYLISVNRTEKSNLQEVSDHFDDYFISTKLRQACYALSREIINQESYDLKLVEEVVQQVINQPTYLEVPAIAVYYYCYQAVSAQGREDYFVKLREAIHRYQHLFPPAEMRDIYTVAINYSIRKLNTGNRIFIREAFELYSLSLQQGFLIENGVMLDSTYTNLVSLACKQQKYEWAIAFINDHQHHLKPTSQAPLYHFSLGRIFYEKGQLENSLQQLAKVDARASYIFLGARVLQLKIYYELDEINPLESLLESLRVYLQRSKDLAYRKAHYSNIITFTKQLLQLPAMSKEEKAAFRKRVEKAETFGERDWFLGKIGG